MGTCFQHALLILCITVVAAGCTRSNPSYSGTDASVISGDGGPDRDGAGDGSAQPDRGSTGDQGSPDRKPPGPPKPNGVDVLVVVDNSVLMEIAQEWLARDMDALIKVLDKMPGGPNYRIGMVSTDLGIGQFQTSICSVSGDGGELIVPSGCPQPFQGATYLSRLGEQRNVEGTIDQAISCWVQSMGTEGCGFEHQLEAMRAALSGANPGFLRPDAALAVIILSNEDDCSAKNTSLFDPNDFSLGPYSSYRCFQYGVLCNGYPPPLQTAQLTGCKPGQSWLYDVKTRYVDFLKGLKPSAQWVSVLVIAGKPASVTDVVEYSDYGESFFTLYPCCSSGEVDGLPAFRLFEFANHFGNGSFESICATNYRAALGPAPGLGGRIMSVF